SAHCALITILRISEVPMLRLSLSGMALLLCTMATLAAAAGEQEDWVNLFDGKSLDGWIQKNGTAAYRIEGDAIVGKTTEGSPNSFLCTEKEYGDFAMEFDVKVS